MGLVPKPDIIDYFNLSEASIAHLGACWGIAFEPIAFPFLIEQDGCTLLQIRSSTSRKAILTDGRQRYFLKEIPWYARDQGQVDTICALQQSLAHSACPVLPLFPTTTAKLYAELDGAPFTLAPFVAGSRYAGSAHERSEAGRALAAFHDSGAALPDAPRKDYLSLVHDFVQLARQTASATADDQSSAASFLRDIDERLASAVDGACREGWQDLPAGPVHGDFSPWNLIFDRHANVVAMVDFDNFDVGPRLRDVVEAVFTFSGISYANDSTSFAAPFEARWHADRAREILGAYAAATESAFSAAEQRCADFILETLFIEYVCLGLLRGDIDVRRDATTIRAWLDRPPRLSQLMRSVA